MDGKLGELLSQEGSVLVADFARGCQTASLREHLMSYPARSPKESVEKLTLVAALMIHTGTCLGDGERRHLLGMPSKTA